MIQIAGRYLDSTLKNLDLPTAEADAARTNAKNIVTKIVGAYAANISSDHVGKRSLPIQKGFAPSAHRHLLTGLVYGRIQSGKTRAMIASSALAFDNGFRIVVVLTSNINDPVSQTHFDFASGLPDVMVYTKDDALTAEIENTKLDLEAADGRLLVICSKGANSLTNVTHFLNQIGAQRYPTIIFDDEGDQASLDTNARRRSQSAVAVAPSSINRLIQNRLRNTVPCHVYVSVTGTPQAVLLQSADSQNRPSFLVQLPPGDSYVGGDRFFATDEPEANDDHLIRVVDMNERAQLLNETAPIPDGLQRAIIFFLLASAAAIHLRGLPPHGKGYSFLCHPSLKNTEQGVAAQRISSFLNAVKATLLNVKGQKKRIIQLLEDEYEDLKLTLAQQTPSLEKLRRAIVGYLRTRKLLIINTSAKRQGISYGPTLNFLIGGNTLGRGIAIRDLLVTYYLRDSKISQIDTMHQHARMFGYRSKTLPFTRLFIPLHLYYRFRDIHHSDRDLREYIESHGETPATFPIEYTSVLRATRTDVLDVNKTDALIPGMQIYPNFIVLPQKKQARTSIRSKLQAHLGHGSHLERRGKSGVKISVQEALSIVSAIKTRSRNTWRDATIEAVVKRVAREFGNEVMLKFRSARRTIAKDGFISTGTLSGDEFQTAKSEKMPTLWIIDVESTEQSGAGGGLNFMYPTFVIPDSLPKLLIFNKG